MLNFTLIKLTLCLIVGIFVGYFYPIPLEISVAISVSCVVILFVLLGIAKTRLKKTIWFGLLAYLTMISAGALSLNLHDQRHNKNHYTHVLNNNTDSLNTLTFKIRETLKPNAYNRKYVVDLITLDNNTVNGKLLLNVRQDSTNTPIAVDDVFICKTKLQKVAPPLNPYQFNYKAYLQRQGIYHQLYIEKVALYKAETTKTTLYGMADRFRLRINSNLKKHDFSPEALAVINALLLGQRQDISDNLRSNYVNAGAIHILAISGLHIGIILFILNFVLKPLERLKHGALIKMILLVLILWCFAFIAGLSASVTRAVTMFSMLAITINLKRPTNTYNTLTLSLFVLLLAKPTFLFDVGFQLSYLAVFGIISIDPLLYKLWQPRYTLVNVFWHTLTVTLSAQLGVLPLSLFYFHQFPGLFFVSSLVILPVFGIVLGFGLLVIVLATLNMLPNILAKLFGFLIDSLNAFVAWVARQSSFIVQDIAINIWQVLAFYFLLFTIVALIRKYNYARLKLVLIAVIVLQCSYIFTIYNKPKNTFIVFQKNRFSLIGNVSQNQIAVANDFDSITKSTNTIIKNYCVESHIKTVKTESLKSVYILNLTSVLAVDSLGAYKVKSFRPDYVLLRQSPKINLNRLIDSINPRHIIADGSNYKSYILRWKAICLKRKLPFHSTSETGAFIIEY